MDHDFRTGEKYEVDKLSRYADQDMWIARWIPQAAAGND